MFVFVLENAILTAAVRRRNHFVVSLLIMCFRVEAEGKDTADEDSNMP
jgi:hypothetical protein